MNVAIVGEKGGGGKTTFATNLAGIRASRVGNGHVALLDTDRQGSSQFWNEERVGHGNGLSQIEVLSAYGESYKRAMSDRKPRFTDSVADIPPGDSDEQRTALYTADCLIIPVQPGASDIWTLSLLDVRVAEAMEDRPGLKAWIVLNRVSTHPGNRDRADALEAIRQTCKTIQVADAQVSDRVSLRRAFNEGLTVEEYRPADNRGINEILSVYELAFGEESKNGNQA